MFQVYDCLANQHDLRLVGLAALVCVGAVFTGLTLFARAKARSGERQWPWIVGASSAIGCGVWTTHFIAMLAYAPAVLVSYDIILTLASLVIAVGVSGLGFMLALHRQPSAAPIGGAVIGLGIALMHYTGMSALELPGHIQWSKLLVHSSILFGVLFASASITLSQSATTKRGFLFAVVLLALGIVILHFIGMGAVQIIPDPSRAVAGLSVAPGSLAIVLASVAIAILGLCLVAAFADRTSKEQLALLNDALGHMSQGLVMFDKNGKLVLWNRRYAEIYLLEGRIEVGYTLEDLMRQRYEAGTLMEDPVSYAQRAEAAAKSGKSFKHVFDLPNGRKVAGANVARPSGGWVSTHEDITDQTALEKERQRRVATDLTISEFRQQAGELLESVRQSIAVMQKTAASLLSTSHHTSQYAGEAVTAFNDASNNVSLVASSANELSESISEISTQLGTTTEMVSLAVREAEATDGEIAGLSVAAEKIGEVVNFIQGIAAKTNLLALNATIEAARAGEAGRGFSIVASEVKSLSVQTSKATNDIGKHIQNVQDSTRTAIATIRKIAGRMKEINSYTAAVVRSVGQQSAATTEISQNAASVAKRTSIVSSVLDEVAQATNKAQTSAEIVRGAAESVEKAVAALNDQVEKFLVKVAA